VKVVGEYLVLNGAGNDGFGALYSTRGVNTWAASVILGSSGSGNFPEPAAIVLDRPFFFFIRDVPTGAILFGGRVNDPTAH